MKTIFTCLLLLVSTAHAAESMNDLLQKMQTSTGADYIKVRTVLAAQTQYKNSLADLVQQARWSKDSWRQDAYAQNCLYLDAPSECLSAILQCRKH